MVCLVPAEGPFRHSFVPSKPAPVFKFRSLWVYLPRFQQRLVCSNLLDPVCVSAALNRMCKQKNKSVKEGPTEGEVDRYILDQLCVFPNSTADLLKSTAGPERCCLGSGMGAHIRPVLASLHRPLVKFRMHFKKLPSRSVFTWSFPLLLKRVYNSSSSNQSAMHSKWKQPCSKSGPGGRALQDRGYQNQLPV